MGDIEQQRAKKFYELRQNGATTEEIANTYFLPIARVSQIIKDYEREYQLPSSAPRMRTQAQREEEFYKLKLNGATVEEIAGMYSVTPSSVYRAIAIYKREHELSDAQAEASDKPPVLNVREVADQRGKEFRDLRLKGVTLEDIASMHGLTRQRADQVIKRYEYKYNLPSSTDTKRELTQKANQADRKEYKETQKLEKQKQYKRFVPCFQIDAHLVGRFLKELGDKAVLYGYDGKSLSNPKGRRDGTIYPSSRTPTNVFLSQGTGEARGHLFVHTWVLWQYGVKLEKGQHCHHIDGDVTNNMFENLQIISNVEHGRLTMQWQRDAGILTPSLTEEQVEEIRTAYKPGVTSITALAKAYGCNWITIRNALYGLGAYNNFNPATRHVQKQSDAEQILLDFGL